MFVAMIEGGGGQGLLCMGLWVGIRVFLKGWSLSCDRALLSYLYTYVLNIHTYMTK